MRTKAWKRSAISDEDGMSLPQGKTCGDCHHFRRCNAMFGHIESDEVCDWAPSRFLAADTGDDD
jgi:hypothetical protein